MTDEELIAAIRNRIHDAPMKTEHLLDAAADRIEALLQQIWDMKFDHRCELREAYNRTV